MSDLASGWLWPEGKAVRWWTPAATGLLELVSPANPAVSCPLDELRDDWRAVPLTRGLAQPLGELVATLLRQFACLQLNLSAALGSDWQHFPYEWLRLDGATLHGRLAVARYAPCTAAPPRPVTARRIVVLNLWPRDDPCQPLDEVPLLDEVQIIDGSHAAEHFLQQTDPTDCAALCVFGHGTEQADGPPFRLANGETWQLPTAHGLPPLVILLACGNDRGNLLDTGHSLLAAGAQTVLAPLGRPTARGASRFLQAFLPHLASWRNRGSRAARHSMPGQRPGSRLPFTTPGAG